MLIIRLKKKIEEHGYMTVALALGYQSQMAIYHWVKKGSIPKIAEKKVKEYLKGEKRENK